MKRTIDDIDGQPVDVEIEDALPTNRIGEMIQALLLALHIYDNREALDASYLPPYKPYPRKKKKENVK